jgi:hypothetical protein
MLLHHETNLGNDGVIELEEDNDCISINIGQERYNNIFKTIEESVTKKKKEKYNEDIDFDEIRDILEENGILLYGYSGTYE